MFGYWKRQAKSWEAMCHQVADQRDKADLQLAAERDDNARLRAKLKTTRDQLDVAGGSATGFEVAADLLGAKLNTVQAGLDHATRCYEQCEADRQAIAKERDEWRETAEYASDLTNQTFAVCERFVRELADLKGKLNARSDHADAGCRSRPDRQACADCGRTDAAPDRDPDFIRFPRAEDGPAFRAFCLVDDPDCDPDAA